LYPRKNSRIALEGLQNLRVCLFKQSDRFC
jgi:hypothetical protein